MIRRASGATDRSRPARPERRISEDDDAATSPAIAPSREVVKS
jgi:hypothetical protein